MHVLSTCKSLPGGCVRESAVLQCCFIKSVQVLPLKQLCTLLMTLSAVQQAQADAGRRFPAEGAHQLRRLCPGQPKKFSV